MSGNGGKFMFNIQQSAVDPHTTPRPVQRTDGQVRPRRRRTRLRAHGVHQVQGAEPARQRLVNRSGKRRPRGDEVSDGGDGAGLMAVAYPLRPGAKSCSRLTSLTGPTGRSLMA
jgi:hypothetical protein